MIVNIKYAWLVRDKSGTLWLHFKKPEKGKFGWLSNGLKRMYSERQDYPEISWNDTEPTKVILECC